ncbi:MAG: hypothetical protein K2W95_29800 [Candidatus Obscuribacterales bacterium]|nr:hypothetical protein [Candidatus Obscuribacterales bacterium]
MGVTAATMASVVTTILEPQEKIEAVFEQDAAYIGAYVMRRSALIIVGMLGASIAMTFVAPVWIGAALGSMVLLFTGILFAAVKASARTHFYVLTSYRVINIWFVPSADPRSSFDKNRLSWVSVASINEVSVVDTTGSVGTLLLQLEEGRKDEMPGLKNVKVAHTQLLNAMSRTDRPLI